MAGVRALPLQVRFFAGESVGSYVTRLAGRNRVSVPYLLQEVGEGRSAALVDPRYTELYVDRTGRERLAALSGRPVAQMVRALPSLRDEHLLPPGGAGPVWRWPWAPHGGYVVRGCALCAARRGIAAPVWMLCPDMWHICVRHGRLTDNSRNDARPFIDLARGPHVVRAERQRRQLVGRFGTVGRIAVADAFGVLAYKGLCLPRLGTERTTVLRLLPAVVRLARLMAGLERRRREGRLSAEEHTAWLRRHEAAFGGVTLSKVMAAWHTKHRPLPASRAGGGVCPVEAAPHERVHSLQSVEEIACLPWAVLGEVERPFG